MLTSKAKYGLRALLSLAKGYGQGPVMISALAQQEGIPKKFLELILLDLKRAGILHSKKGKGGGYLLGKPPTAIGLGQVIRVLDGPLAPVRCVSQTAYRRCEDCADETTCGIRLAMKEVRDAIARILDGTTLGDVVRRTEALKYRREEALTYHI